MKVYLSFTDSSKNSWAVLRWSIKRNIKDFNTLNIVRNQLKMAKNPNGYVQITICGTYLNKSYFLFVIKTSILVG